MVTSSPVSEFRVHLYHQMTIKHFSAKKHPRLLSAAWVVCLAVAFKVIGSLLLVIEPSASADLFHGKTAYVHTAGSAPVIPIDSPPLEPTFPDESESKDECDDDELGKLIFGLYCKSFELLHAQKLLFLHLRFSIENRSSVGLFVLHHSWKSFIC